MTNDVHLARELGTTSMALQDAYDTLYKRNQELEDARKEIDSLKAQLLLIQLLGHGAILNDDKAVAEGEYQV